MTLGGRDVYLGDWNSVASRKEYRRVVAEWLASGGQGTTTPKEITIVEVIARYWQCVRSYYRKPNGRPTETQDHIRRALKPVTQTNEEQDDAQRDDQCCRV